MNTSTSPDLVHEQRILCCRCVAGLPARPHIHADALDRRLHAQGAVDPDLLIIGFWLGFSFGLRERVASPLRTLANLLEAMREGDYSIRARGVKSDDAMGEVMQQVNAMGATLRAQRLGALEATTLLAQGDGGDRRRGVRFRRRAPPAPGEPRRRSDC